ncbi:hypothetical protein COOONC_23356, partial [Cooperia oncophora]
MKPDKRFGFRKKLSFCVFGESRAELKVDAEIMAKARGNLRRALLSMKARLLRESLKCTPSSARGEVIKMAALGEHQENR